MVPRQANRIRKGGDTVVATTNLGAGSIPLHPTVGSTAIRSAAAPFVEIVSELFLWVSLRGLFSV